MSRRGCLITLQRLLTKYNQPVLMICKRFVVVPTEFIWISPKNLLLINNKNISINLTRTVIDYCFNEGITNLVIHTSALQIMAQIVCSFNEQKISNERYFSELNICKISETMAFTDLIRSINND